MNALATLTATTPNPDSDPDLTATARLPSHNDRPGEQPPATSAEPPQSAPLLALLPAQETAASTVAARYAMRPAAMALAASATVRPPAANKIDQPAHAARHAARPAAVDGAVDTAADTPPRTAFGTAASTAVSTAASTAPVTVSGSLAYTPVSTTASDVPGTASGSPANTPANTAANTPVSTAAPAVPGTVSGSLTNAPAFTVPGTASGSLADAKRSTPAATTPASSAVSSPPGRGAVVLGEVVPRIPDPVLATATPNDPTTADRHARLLLHRAAEPGDQLVCRLVERFGAPTVASAILSGSAADLLPAADEECAADRASLADRAHTLQTRCYRADPDADLAVAAKTGARYVIPADPDWPEALDDLGDAVPLGVWLLGDADLPTAAARGVSVVGARIATGYGMHVAGELAAGLADRGWSVVSGAARGIDGAAHRGALAARGITIAVLACGIDLVYPRGHEALIGAIAADGLVVSELPPGTNVSRFRFLDRNRVIAALGRGTVVVEAAARSGSLVTARLADELGRPILAVPGPVTSEASEGTHQLIRDGALLVTRAAEVVEHLGDLGTDLAEPTPSSRSAARRPRDALDTIAARVLDALPAQGRGALDTVEAALAAGLEPRVVHSALGRLAESGWVDRSERGWSARLRL